MNDQSTRQAAKPTSRYRDRLTGHEVRYPLQCWVALVCIDAGLRHRARNQMTRIRAIDLFCGAGGSSWGAWRAGVQIVAGLDVWNRATDVYRANFPEARALTVRLDEVNPSRLATELGPINLILASPECTNHSSAKGAGVRDEASRLTAFEVVRFAEAFSPRWIVVENVVSMRRWDRYPDFINALTGLGYGIRSQTLDASDFGVPQRRRRIFIVCDRFAEPRTVISEPTPPIPVRSILQSDDAFRFTPLHTPNRAQATLERAERAIATLGRNASFLLVYYGTDGAGGWQPLDVPLRTITTLDRFSLVRPDGYGHRMRMLQVPELKAAMGMPATFRIEGGTRRDRIKLIGNAVCPPVMQAVVTYLTASSAQVAACVSAHQEGCSTRVVASN